MSTSDTAVDEFHNHLDDCKRCRDRPFDMCPEGVRLIRQAGKTLSPQLSELRVIHLDLGF